MEKLRLNDKPAIRIAARFIRSYTRKGKTSELYDCEGDQVWFPRKCVKASGDTILIEEWLYNKKVEEGDL